MKIFNLLITLVFIVAANSLQANEYKYTINIKQNFFRSKDRNNIIFIPTNGKIKCAAPSASKDSSEFSTMCEGFSAVDINTNKVVSAAEIAFGVGYMNTVMLDTPPSKEDGIIVYFEEAIVTTEENKEIIEQVMRKHVSTF